MSGPRAPHSLRHEPQSTPLKFEEPVISESVTRWPFAVMILSRTYHWETGVMLMWSTLLSRADLEKVAAGTVCLLVVLNHYMRALAGTVAHLATSTEEMH
jgi:hypothetical protein